MKKLLVILFSLFAFKGISQPVVGRSSQANTVKDARWMAQYNMYVPVYPDTATANLPGNIGIDTCYAIIATRDVNACWYRQCNPKKWVIIGSGSSSGTVTSFSSGNLSPLFTTSVATSTTTPALSFSLSNASAYSFFGRASGVGVPSFISGLDSNWAPDLHSENYYNTKYVPLARSISTGYGLTGGGDFSTNRTHIWDSLTAYLTGLRRKDSATASFLNGYLTRTSVLPYLPTTPGLQDVITQDPVLTAADNTITHTGDNVFKIRKNITTSVSGSAFDAELNISGTANVNSPYVGRFVFNVNGSGSIGGANANGVAAELNVGASGNIGVYTGFRTVTTTTTGSAISYWEGVSVDGFQNNSTIGNCYAFYSGGPSSGTGTIINEYGLYLGSALAPVTNQYGIYIENKNIGTSEAYAIYTNAGKNRFGDSTIQDGGLRITSGSPGAGKVLVSDAVGKASWSSSPAAGSVPISGLTAATGTNTIDNGLHAQEWQWNTLAAGTGLLLSSTSTAAASNTQNLFSVQLTGANSTSTQETFAGSFLNGHTGTSSTNVGIYSFATNGTTNVAGRFIATGGTNNYAIIVPASSGSVGIGTSAPAKIFHTVGTVRHATLGTASADTTTYKPMGIDANGDVFPMTYWPGGGGGSTSPAGNFGNLQINRNGAFATPGSDSLDFDAGLVVKGNITSSTLTSGRLALVGTAGLITDDAMYLYDGADLTVTGGGSGNIGLAGRNTDASGRTTLKLGNDQSALSGFIAVNGTSKTDYSGAGSLFFLNINNAAVGFHTNNVDLARLYIGGDGSIGISTEAPNSTLQNTGSWAGAYVAKSATYTATIADQTIECTSGTFTVTLPTSVGITGRVYYIVNSGAGVITIATTSSQTFVNVVATPTTLTLSAVGVYQVQANGANWMVLSVN